MIRPLRKLMLHRYPYMYEPMQLAVLVSSLDEALSHCPNGMLVEVGCAAGHTTIFLSRHLYMSKYRGQYYAYDTFRGFAHDDQQSELAAGRIGSTKQCDFSLNDRRWVQWAIDQNVRMAKTKLVEVDAAKHDFSELNATVAFVLLERLQRIGGDQACRGRRGQTRFQRVERDRGFCVARAASKNTESFDGAYVRFG